MKTCQMCKKEVKEAPISLRMETREFHFCNSQCLILNLLKAMSAPISPFNSDIKEMAIILALTIKIDSNTPAFNAKLAEIKAKYGSFVPFSSEQF